MWMRQDLAYFQCPEGPPEKVTLLRIFAKVFWACFLWGSGTAIGEIPPYAVSRAAALAGQELEDSDISKGVQEAKEELRREGEKGRRRCSCSCGFSLSPTEMKKCMARFIIQYGFWGVLLLSAWPNMAFDLCGMVCGYFLMSFQKFFVATWMGKGLIKVNVQALVLIILFTQSYLERLLHGIDTLFPSSWEVSKKIQNLVDERRKNLHGDTHQTSWFSYISTSVIFLCIFVFAISCVNSFAQARFVREQNKKLEDIIRESKKQQ